MKVVKSKFLLFIAFSLSAMLFSSVVVLPSFSHETGDGLPLSPWGPYSKSDVGPSFISDWQKGLLFHFPIVMGAVLSDGSIICNLTHWRPYWVEEGAWTTWQTPIIKALPDLSFWQGRFISPDKSFYSTFDVAVVDPNTVVIEVNFFSLDLKSYSFFCDIVAGVPEGRENSSGISSRSSIFYDKGILVYKYETGKKDEYYVVTCDESHVGGVLKGGNYGMALMKRWSVQDAGFFRSGKVKMFGFVECLNIRPSRSVHFAVAHGLSVDEAVTRALESLRSARLMVQKARERYKDWQAMLMGGTKPIPSEISFLISQTLANVVFETEKGLNARIFVPGRNWSRSFQWDGGFISIGLTEISKPLAIKSLDALFENGNHRQWKPEYMDINPPIHIFAIEEIYESFDDLNLLKHFLPLAWSSLERMCRYGDPDRDNLYDWGLPRKIYAFSSGMDFLPVWNFARAQEPFRRIESPDFSALLVRAFKIVAVLARQAGMEKIADESLKRARSVSEAMNKYLWDPSEKIFYPVWAEANQKIRGYQKTIISIYPLISGREAITVDQAKALIERLRDDWHYRSRCGIRSVEADAPYFHPNQPWKGDVWVATQWLMWKSLLDWGETEFAGEIAESVLRCFKSAYDKVGHSMESFDGASGKPIGQIDFSGLTTPLINLYMAYNRPGQFTGGFDTSVKEHFYDEKADMLVGSVQVNFGGDSSVGMIAVMGRPYRKYDVFVCGRHVARVRSDEGGAIGLVLKLPKDSSSFIVIRPVRWKDD